MLLELTAEINKASTAIGIIIVALFCTMSLVSIIANKLKNAGLVDIIWSASFGIICLFLAAYYNQFSLWPKMIFTLMVSLSSLRLTAHITQRFLHDYPNEDPRYNSFRKEFKGKANSKFFVLFQFQGILILILSLPFLLLYQSNHLIPTGPFILSIILFLIGLCGEILADSQLNYYKQHATETGGICKKGLWQFSRHPNYFFQWLLWVSYSLFITASHPLGWLSIIQPITMYIVLTKMSGVALTETHMLSTRGKKYKVYQEQTNAFFPWFPKQTEGSPQ